MLWRNHFLSYYYRGISHEDNGIGMQKEREEERELAEEVEHDSLFKARKGVYTAVSLSFHTKYHFNNKGA